MLFSMIMETLSVGLIIPIISLLSEPNILLSNEWLNDNFPMLSSFTEIEFVAYGLVLLVSVYLIKALFLSFYYWKLNAFSYSLCISLSEELYLGYLKSPWTFHIKNNSAYLLRNIAAEVNILISSVIVPLLRLFTECLVVMGIGILLMIIEPVGTVSVFLLMGIAGFSFQKITSSKVSKWGEQRIQHEGKKILQLQQGLSAVKEIKLLGREEGFLKLFQPHNLKSAESLQYKLFIQQLPRLFLEVIAIGGLTLLVAILLVRGNSFESLLPVIGLFAAAVFRLIPSINRIIDSLQNLNYGVPSVTVLKKELDFVRNISQEENGSVIKFQHKLTFRNVSYSYPGTEKIIFGDVNLTINKGEIIGLIGASGAGKTTLVDMLLGLLPPTIGSITSDGVNINQNLAGWQKNLGYVQQSISLLDDSLLNNIAFGLKESEIDSELIVYAVNAAQLDGLVESLPEGLHTNIGEKGVKLSGGQRQRIGIARALYRNPELLVLDEATSALDSETEKLIMGAIYQLGKSKTIIIIAHRLSTVEHCDRLYKLEAGKLISSNNLSEAVPQ